MWSILIDDYLTSSLAIFVILIEIALSFQRYFILTNQTFFLNVLESYVKVFSILFIFSLAYYLPMLFRKNILRTQVNYYSLNTSILVETLQVYSIVETDFGASSLGHWIPVALTVIRIILGTVVLTAVNVLNAIKFEKRIRKKINLKLKVAATAVLGL